MKAKSLMLAAFMIVLLSAVNVAESTQGNLLLREKADEPPTTKVVKLIKELKLRAENDGKKAQQSYDTYACFCESKLAEKAAAMNSEKELIAEKQTLIFKLKGEIGAHSAEVAQAKKAISENKAAAKDAEAVRKNEFKQYETAKLGSEQSIGSLEAAIKVMTGAGAKKGFLDTTTHQAQLLSVVGQMRPVVKQSLPSSIPSKDVELLKSFLANPAAFFPQSPHALSAVQVGQNPFGDYASQSTQIQGVFKGMYDAFTAELEQSNVEEATSQKAYEALKAVKASELATLAATLQSTEGNLADKSEELAEANSLRDETADALEADTAFFEDTKEACATKAKEWSVQTRLRTEELNGMNTAIEILTDGGKTLKSSFKTLVQLSSTKRHDLSQSGAEKAFKKLQALATKFKSMQLAKVAVAARSTGHFDSVFPVIDKMMITLRQEEQDDIEKRDSCEGLENDNKNDLADLEHSITKTQKALDRMATTKKELQSEISELEDSIETDSKSRAELLKMRNAASSEFQQALKDDTEAVALMNGAIASLSKFYKDNGSFIQMAHKAPTYSKDEDAAPETSWSGSAYGGRKSETTGIIATLDMLVEDIQKEIAEGKADDADAQSKYEKQDAALSASQEAQTATKVTTEKVLAELDEKRADYHSFKDGKSNDKEAEEDRKKAIFLDCNWVRTNFKSRASKRKDEMQGLADAKDFLSGGLR